MENREIIRRTIQNIRRYNNGAILGFDKLFSNSEVGLIFDPSDNSTIFQDILGTGTIPITNTGQAVSLILDKSQGAELGPELTPTLTYPLTVYRDAVTNTSAVTSTPIVAGRFYKIEIDVIDNSGISASFRIGVASSFSPGIGIPTSFNGTRTVYSRAIATGNIVITGDANGTDLKVTRFSCKELPGNHAYQLTGTARPIYGIVPKTGRRNICTLTDTLTDGSFVKTSTTIESTTEVAPDGSLDAFLLKETSLNSTHQFGYGSVLPFVSGTTYTFSFYAKAINRSLIGFLSGSAYFSSEDYAVWDLENGTVFREGTAPGSTTIEDVGNGWYRCTRTLTSGATGNSGWSVGLRVTGTASRTETYVGTLGLEGVYLFGFQCEVGTTATPYQLVRDQYYVTEQNVPTCHYLKFDGIDDFLVTNTIDFSSVDEVTCFSGLRKLGDTAVGMVYELGTGSGARFHLTAPQAISGNNFAFLSMVTISANPILTGFTSPISAFITCKGSISQPLSSISANGGTPVEITTNQGTGVYQSAPIYIGRRAGTSLPFNGQIFCLLIRGASSTTPEIIQAERLLAKKTSDI